MSMKRLWPLIPMAAGLMLILAGFVYDVFFAGIPYQDPTPELAAAYARHADNAACMFRSGAAIFVAGLACAAVNTILLRLRPSTRRI